LSERTAAGFHADGTDGPHDGNVRRPAVATCFSREDTQNFAKVRAVGSVRRGAEANLETLGPASVFGVVARFVEIADGVDETAVFRLFG
jgi:hypothetical protein